MIIGSASYSQSNIDTISNTKLEEVVVTATKTLRQLSTLPMPAKLITKEEIAFIESMIRPMESGDE